MLGLVCGPAPLSQVSHVTYARDDCVPCEPPALLPAAYPTVYRQAGLPLTSYPIAPFNPVFVPYPASPVHPSPRRYSAPPYPAAPLSLMPETPITLPAPYTPPRATPDYGPLFNAPPTPLQYAPSPLDTLHSQVARLEQDLAAASHRMEEMERIILSQQSQITAISSQPAPRTGKTGKAGKAKPAASSPKAPGATRPPGQPTRAYLAIQREFNATRRVTRRLSSGSGGGGGGVARPKRRAKSPPIEPTPPADSLSYSSTIPARSTSLLGPWPHEARPAASTRPPTAPSSRATSPALTSTAPPETVQAPFNRTRSVSPPFR
eukprot:EG_transcript_17801